MVSQRIYIPALAFLGSGGAVWTLWKVNIKWLSKSTSISPVSIKIQSRGALLSVVLPLLALLAFPFVFRSYFEPPLEPRIIYDAEHGNVPAQYSLGLTYEMRGDLTESYFWFSLAEKHGLGDPHGIDPIVESNLTPEQKADVAKRVAEWKPAPQPGAVSITPRQRR